MNNTNVLRKYQKNRFFKNPSKIQEKFGNCSLIILKESQIELIHLSMIKFLLKNCLKKKKKFFQVNEKIWYFGRINFYLQKKSKNSRMGKGKGMLERQVIRVKKNQKIFEFKGFSNIRLNKFVYFLKKKTTLKVFLNLKRTNKYNLWCDNKKFLTYFDKYLIY